MKLVIISGFSGAGKSIALHALEDEGFYCIDNLTLDLLKFMFVQSSPAHLKIGEKIAVSLDIRGLDQISAEDFATLLKQIKQNDVQVEVVFIEAGMKTLVQRYQEVKRPHPLGSKYSTLADAITAEDQYLDPIRQYANTIFDTSNLLYYELITQIRSQVCRTSNQVFLLLQSFGYKKGIPLDSNYVFDVRCLLNPYWHKHLRKLTGKDPAVKQFLENNTKCQEMLQHIHSFLDAWLKEFIKQGTRNLTVSIGCTGGQHRSVYMVESLFNALHDSPDHVVNKSHRELGL